MFLDRISGSCDYARCGIVYPFLNTVCGSYILEQAHAVFAFPLQQRRLRPRCEDCIDFTCQKCFGLAAVLAAGRYIQIVASNVAPFTWILAIDNINELDGSRRAIVHGKCGNQAL